MPFGFGRNHDAKRPDVAIVPVATVENQLIADMVKGILEMNRIPCMTRAGGMGMVYLGPALQPHDILIRAADRERAEEVLHAFSDAEDVKLLWR